MNARKPVQRASHRCRMVGSHQSVCAHRSVYRCRPASQSLGGTSTSSRRPLAQQQRPEKATIRDARNGPRARRCASVVWKKPHGAGLVPAAEWYAPIGASAHALMCLGNCLVSSSERRASRSLRACATGNGGVRRPDNVRKRPGVRGAGGFASYKRRGARLMGRVNASERVDKRRYEQAKVADTLGRNSCVVGSVPGDWTDAAIGTTGEQTAPNPVMLLKWNSVSPSLRPLGGREAARRPVAVAGRGRWRKRTTRCNYTGMKHARRGNPCRLPPGRSSRDDRLNPVKEHPARPAKPGVLNPRPLRGGDGFRSPSQKEDSMKAQRSCLHPPAVRPSGDRWRHVERTVRGMPHREGSAGRQIARREPCKGC